MKSIILFSRCEFVDLYGSISERLSINFNAIQLSYSKLEDVLRNKQKINFKHKISLILNNKNKDIPIDKLDSLLLNRLKGAFHLILLYKAIEVFLFLIIQKQQG